jgi:hypothetical protein
MKRPVLFVVLLLAPFLLTGCPPPFYLTVFNNTGAAIEVRSDEDKDLIARGQLKKFDYPQRDDVFRLSGRGCEYLYDFSVKLGNYDIDRTLFRGIQIQVEEDFSVNLLSGSYAGDAPASEDMILKREGFPLRPVSRKCGSAPKP